jgi:hypothetical protein
MAYTYTDIILLEDEALLDGILEGTAALSGSLSASGVLAIASDKSGTAELVGTLSAAGSLSFPLVLSGSAALSGSLTGAGATTFLWVALGTAALSGSLSAAGSLAIAADKAGTAALSATLTSQGSLSFTATNYAYTDIVVLEDEALGLPLFVGSNRISSVYWGGRTLSAIWHQGEQVWP